MLQKLLKLSYQGIFEVSYVNDAEALNPKEKYWLSIKADDRQQALEELSSFNYPKECVELILSPERSTRINVYGKDLLVNIKVAQSQNIYLSEYLTIILRKGVLVTIIGENNTFLNSLEEEESIQLINYELNLTHLLYFIINELLQDGLDNVSIARARVNALSNKLDEEGVKMSLSEITKTKRDVSQLTNLIEDQQNLLGFLPKVDWTDNENTFRQEYHEMVRGFVQIFNSAERLEEKLNELHGQYQLLLQDKANARLNTLTVIQSIFVPLSFLAGVYGMNFDYMPELHFKYAYFIAWIAMIGITVIQLIWFKRKGWFR